MDIQIQASFYLLVLRTSFFCMATLATLASNLDLIYQLLLCTLVLVLVISGTTGQDPVCSLQCSKEDGHEAQTDGKKLVLELRSGRRIEMRLTSFYCLWWVQILYMHSAHRAAIVVVLPDTCSSEERRQLRQFLVQ